MLIGDSRPLTLYRKDSALRPVRLIALVLLAALTVGVASAQARPVSHKTKQSREQVERYWTAERMKNAIPVERSRQPLATKGGAGGGKPGGGADPAKSFEPSTYPSAHGKVFFSDGPTNYVCSGTALAGANQGVVWTAGHCVNDGPGDYFTNFAFVPAYRDGQAPYGKFVSTELLTTSGWEASQEWGVDLGAAVVGLNASDQTLAQAVEERPIAFDTTRDQAYQLYGYPAAKKFNGQRMRVCDTRWAFDDFADPFTMGVPCDMTGGSSGGGWVTSSGAVASVVSYGYSSLRNYLFGPHMEAEARALYDTAAAE
jgi:V8-like Glu-specific endopeptidase